MSAKDIFGIEVRVNNWIAVSFREGNNAALRVGKVIGFGRRSFYTEKIPTMIVEWCISTGHRIPKKPTSIDSGSANFIIIPRPVTECMQSKEDQIT